MQNTPIKNQRHGTENDPFQFGDISEAFFNPIEMSSAFIKFIGTFIFNILRIACVPAELIFRRKFGERHFNLYLYLGGSLWLGIFATGWLNIPSMLGFRSEGIVPNIVIFSIIAIIFYGRMFWELLIRKSKDIDVTMYTRYDGDPLNIIEKLPLATDKNGNPKDYLIRQLHEPLLMLLLGIVVTVILNPQTGTWLMISAFCMSVKEYVKARHIRNMILDAIDADIISRNTAESIKGAPARDTQGIYIAGVSNDGKDRDMLRDLVTRKQQRFTAGNSTNPVH
jgi:hypothetical protein